MITASIVTYHTNPSDLLRLLRCVLESKVCRLFVVDHSADQRLKDFVCVDNRVEYIRHDNIGYGAGHNVAINKSIKMGARYHVVLNPDVFWNEKVLDSLRRYMESNKECGLVMPYIKYPDGNPQFLCKLVPTPFDLFLRRFIPIKSWQDRLNKSYEMQWTGYDRIMEIPILSGCFMFLRCDTLKKVGGFDERFFLYAEDVDLCRRIGEVSQTIFYPHVSVIHEYAKGSYKNKKMMKMHILSIIKYFNKWGWFFDSKRVSRNRECVSKIISPTLEDSSVNSDQFMSAHFRMDTHSQCELEEVYNKHC